MTYCLVVSRLVFLKFSSFSSVPNDLDDWTSYIAAIDEILQAANPRVVP